MNALCHNLQVLLLFLGLIGYLLKWITPLTIAPAVTMIGMSLFKVSAELASKNWLISML